MTSELPVVTPDAALPSATPAQPASASGAWGDWIGMVASIGCAIHCAAMPFVIAYLPALGLSFLADEAFHKWMAVACFGIALTAFIPGIRTHGRWSPVSLASVGLVMISFAAFGLAGECCPSCAADPTTVAAADADACTDPDCPLCPAESHAPADAGTEVSLATLASVSEPTPEWLSRIAPWITPVGGLVLVSAHLLNRRYGCLCGCCSTETTEGTPE